MIVDPIKKFGVITIRGKLGAPEKNGNDENRGIYQMRRHGNERVCVKMVYYKPTNDPSSAQISQRNKMRVAVSVWHGMSSDARALYERFAKNYQMSGYNLFLGRYMKTL